MLSLPCIMLKTRIMIKAISIIILVISSTLSPAKVFDTYLNCAHNHICYRAKCKCSSYGELTMFKEFKAINKHNSNLWIADTIFYKNDSISQIENLKYLLYVDSICMNRNNISSFNIKHTTCKEFRDPSLNLYIKARYNDSILWQLIVVDDTNFDRIITVYHLNTNAVICVEYTISGPDIYSLPPSSTTYMFYYKDGKEIGYVLKKYLGGIVFKVGPEINKDFITNKEVKLNNFLIYKDKIESAK